MELSMKINARPCNMVPEGNNNFPGRFFVNVKDTSGIFLITLWWGNKSAQIVRSDTYITSRVKGRHPFRTQNGPKTFFYGNTIFNENSFHVPLHPLQGAKVDSGQNLTQKNNEKNGVKSTFIFSSCQDQPLDSWLSFSNSVRTTLV